MVPPLESWPVSELPERVQVYQKRFKDKRRKEPIDLRKCELLEMVQHSCWPDERALEVVQGQLRVNLREFGDITCTPVVRLFRRCANGVTVETTSWERPGAAHAKEKPVIAEPPDNKVPITTSKSTWSSKWWSNQ